MKYLSVSICLSFILISNCFSQSLTADELKDIKKAYAKLHIVDCTNAKTKKLFWDNVVRCNVEYQDYVIKDTKMAKNSHNETIAKLVESNKFIDYDFFISEKDVEGITEVETRYKKYLLGDDYNDISMIRIEPSSEYNAYSIQSGLICVTTGLYLNFTEEEMIFILAHEYTHMILKHFETENYATRRNNFKNELIGSILGGVAMGTLAYGATQTNDTDVIDESFNQMDNIMKSTRKAIDYYNGLSHPKYSRIHEMEADAYATEFISSLGISPDVAINVMNKLINKDGDNPTNEYSDHPRLSFRKKAIAYLIQSGFNPNNKTKIKAKKEVRSNDDIYN